MCIGMYQPTEDKQGKHRGLLVRLGAAVLSHFTLASRAGAVLEITAVPCQTVLCGEAAQAAAALQVLGSIMDVEHRALQAQLGNLWLLLWAAGSDEGKDSSGPPLP